MKKLLPIILLFATLLTGKAWATLPVYDYGNFIQNQVYYDVFAGELGDIAIAADATAVAAADSAIIDDYQVFYNFNEPLGHALAFTGWGGSMASQSVMTTEKLAELHNQQEILQESLTKQAKVMALTPRQIWAKIKSFFSGNYMKTMRDTLTNKLNNIQETLVNKFGEKAIETMMANLIQDIMSCRTPQLNALFPSIDLGLGIGLCDYKQMFSDMKEQANAIRDRGWGGTFTINGQSASDIIKNPSTLKNVIHMNSASTGEALTLDFLSDQSMKASYQASVDASALGQKIASKVAEGKFKRLFADRTLNDAMDDSIQLQTMTIQSNEKNAETMRKLNEVETQIRLLENQRAIRQEHKEAIRDTSAVFNYKLNIQ